MMNSSLIPEFAIVGHPNEGKSSVVSTLAEDDSVRIGPVPGETVRCRAFPVLIDGKEVIRFIDTPGFQSPGYTLSWMKKFEEDQERQSFDVASAFCNAHRDDPEFSDECELLSPLSRGAGIIYVVDASRPVRSHDRAEMEILRMTGLPRMAIINCKKRDAEWLDEWKRLFRRHFNAIRVFNAHRATYAERIELLGSLKGIDQDWQPALTKVITAFEADWSQRIDKVSMLVITMLEKIITLNITEKLKDRSHEKKTAGELEAKYRKKIASVEKGAFEKIRKLFKHNIFNYALPADSIIRSDIFSRRTWQLLGLRPGQLALAAGVAAGGIGAAVDIAAAGLTFGIFSALGGVIGAGSVLLGGKQMVRSRVHGIRLGSEQMTIGPCHNIQLLYVLLDRVIIFYSHTINWAHGRRDYSENGGVNPGHRYSFGLTSHWDEGSQKTCEHFFRSLGGRYMGNKEMARGEMVKLVRQALASLSSGEAGYGLIIR